MYRALYVEWLDLMAQPGVTLESDATTQAFLQHMNRPEIPGLPVHMEISVSSHPLVTCLSNNQFLILAPWASLVRFEQVPQSAFCFQAFH
jgi:hypothetical protein